MLNPGLQLDFEFLTEPGLGLALEFAGFSALYLISAGIGLTIGS